MKSPCNPPANPILEEVPETQPQQNNQEIEEMTCPSLQDTSNLVILDDNLEKMNVQNGLNSITEQRENGNPPPSIVPRENTDTVETNKSLSEEKLTNSKSKNKSARCDSTDALLSDEEKSLVDENNPMDWWVDIPKHILILLKRSFLSYNSLNSEERYFLILNNNLIIISLLYKAFLNICPIFAVPFDSAERWSFFIKLSILFLNFLL